MLEVTHVRHLDLGADAYVAAASGLVLRGEELLVVADDLAGLFAFPRTGDGPGRALVEPPVPPTDHAARKATKPDLESLALLPDGSVLALGSGATDQRERALRWPPERWEDAHDLYAGLRLTLDDLNVEGCAVVGEHLWLAQRGNGANGRNALVQLDLAAGLTAAAVLDVRPVDVPEAGGWPLGLSDLSPLPDGRLLFCAVSEAVASTYEDGPCVAAAIGVLDPVAGEVHVLEELSEPHKVEGCLRDPDGSAVLLVADADDPTAPAPLLRVDVPARFWG